MLSRLLVNLNKSSGGSEPLSIFYCRAQLLAHLGFRLFEDDWTPTPLFQKLALALHLHLNLREADNTPLPLAQITGKVAVGKIIFVQMYSGQEQKKANSKLSDIPVRNSHFRRWTFYNIS